MFKETPDMANWMHPQTEERKKLILEQLDEAKKLFNQLKIKAATGEVPDIGDS